MSDSIKPADVVDYVTVTSELQKRALDEIQVHRSSQEKAKQAAAGLFDRMAEVGLVSRTKQAAVQAMLGSHPETLGLLKRTVEKLAEVSSKLSKQAADLGTADLPAGGPAKPPAAPTRQSFLGGREDRARDSDNTLRRILS